MLGNIPVVDGVVHAFNFDESNYRNTYGESFARLVAGAAHADRPGYALRDPSAYLTDFSIEDTANIAFVESATDLAVYHVLPINAFHDGGCSLEKAIEARRRWPHRFFFYIGADPMEGPKALDDMQRQYDALEGDVVGLKLYPNSWVDGTVRGWLMDDRSIAYPAFEKAQELALKAIAVHKAVPMGPVERLHYNVNDIDRAAMDFPDLNFEIVHGGMAFVEETAWQLARFPNVYVNLEVTVNLLHGRPAEWERVIAAFMSSPEMTDRLVWGTGGFVITHPGPALEEFSQFRFSEDLIAGNGLQQITPEIQRKILSGNFAAMAGVDLRMRLEAAAGDEFEVRRKALAGSAEPYRSAPAVAALVA